MKKWNIISLMLIVVFILDFTGLLHSSADYSNFKGRAISLKILQQQVKDCLGEGSMPTTLYNLCGITQIHGYIIDEANKDIILIGSIDRDKPALYLDDFVIALRNAWMKYTELKGNTNYYSNPGCSIDPDPAVMGKLDEIGNRLKESQSTEQIESALRQWENACHAPQKVRVMGIPFNSHFASVMVKADYDMKKIADGTDELNLLWISTLADLQMDEAKKKHIHGYASSETLGGMNRFWFYPGELRFLEDSNAVMIEICKVKLLTEEEHLTSKGDISGTGGSNPIAEKFANDFSDFYPEVADQRPIYQELENLFRFVALAKVIKLKAPHEKVGLSLQYLLEQYPVSEQEVKMSLPGWPHINRYKSQMGSADGKQVSQLWLPSCGGVLMDIEMKPQLFLKDNGKLEEIKEITLKQGPVPPPLFKEINVDSATYCAIVLLNSYGAFTNGHVAIVLGSKKDGYYYYSKNGSDPNSEGVHYKVLSKYYFPQYDKAFEITISKSQFDAMRLEATNDINTPYDLNMNNCADFVHNVLKSGGGNIDPGNTRTLQPKNYFSYIESHNTGKRLW